MMGSARQSEKPRVLVVEDEIDLREILKFNLLESGYEVRAVESGAHALKEAEAFAPALILLDVMLQDISGVEVCRLIRARADRPRPVIVMVTAKGEEIDRVVGFELGADDYVVKPFSVRELMLRVRAHLRQRIEGPPAESEDEGSRRFTVGTLTIDPESHQVRSGTVDVPVSALEMRLLVYMASREGVVCSRRDLLTHVWNYSPGVTSRTVDTYIKRLRDKLGPASALIQTVRGRGYRMANPADKPDAGI